MAARMASLNTREQGTEEDRSRWKGFFILCAGISVYKGNEEWNQVEYMKSGKED